jgi:hypothetical protein
MFSSTNILFFRGYIKLFVYFLCYCYLFLGVSVIYYALFSIYTLIFITY